MHTAFVVGSSDSQQEHSFFSFNVRLCVCVLLEMAKISLGLGPEMECTSTFLSCRILSLNIQFLILPASAPRENILCDHNLLLYAGSEIYMYFRL